MALAHQLLGEVQPEEGVAPSLRVGDENRVGAADERGAAGRGRGGAGGEGGAHIFRKRIERERLEERV